MTAASVIELLAQEHLKGALFSCEHHRISARGKVRDMVPHKDVIIMINSDRISAFDQVLGTIPLKGALLGEQAHHWFCALNHIVPHHFIERADPQILVVKKAQPFLVEVVVRGYLAGSLMRENPQTRGEAYGLQLDPHLKNYARLDSPILTPSTKAQAGEHDLPLSPKAIIANNIVPKKTWDEIAVIALELFTQASAMAEKNGLLLVDTKYEFGLINGILHLIDEVHTSDSSRFFLAHDYHEKFPRNETPTMLDKECLRQHLLGQGFDPLEGNAQSLLTDELRLELTKRYYMLTEAMTGYDFAPPQEPAISRVWQRLSELIC